MAVVAVLCICKHTARSLCDESLNDNAVRTAHEREYLLARNLLLHTSHCIDMRSSCSDN